MEDEQIMLAVRAGDVGQLARLFDRHHRALFQFFLHLTGNRAASEDLVQEAFYRVLKYRHTYQAESPFRVWLFQVGRNVYRDSAGRNRGEVPMPDGAAAAEIRGPGTLPDRQAQRNQEAELLRRALAALPTDKREVLVMSRYMELSHGEIASVLKCEVGTVKVRVYRALRELSERFFALSGERAS